MRRVRFEHGGEVHHGSLEEVPDDARLLAPVTPGKIVPVGQNYMDHIREQGAKPPGIGERASRVPQEEALGVVAGYTVANDVSARDLQIGDGQWLRGKALDTFLPLGPAVVSADEVGDPQDLPIRTRVNGETMQDSSTSEMVFSVAELIAFITEGITLEPGDVVLTGTPHGVGNFRDPQVFLQPGDVVEVEVGDLGVLTNTVGPHLDKEER